MKKLIAAAFAVGVAVGAGGVRSAAQASHLNGYCVKATSPIVFGAMDGSAQLVVPGESGVIFAMPQTSGRVTVVWAKSFDASGKSREVNQNIVQMASDPAKLEIVACAPHIDYGGNLSPFQGWLP